MVDKLTLLLLAGLAANQIVETVHHSEIFLRLREWAVDAAELAHRRKEVTIGSVAAKIINCPFCLAHWAAAFCVLCLWGQWGAIPIEVLACVRVATLINDVTHGTNRTPNVAIIEQENVGGIA